MKTELKFEEVGGCGDTLSVEDHGERAAEIHRLQDLLRWAYSKLHGRTFSSMDDALKLDELKLLMEHGL